MSVLVLRLLIVLFLAPFSVPAVRIPRGRNRVLLLLLSLGCNLCGKETSSGTRRIALLLIVAAAARRTCKLLLQQVNSAVRISWRCTRLHQRTGKRAAATRLSLAEGHCRRKEQLGLKSRGSLRVVMRVELVDLCIHLVQLGIVVLRVVFWIGVGHPLTAENVCDLAALLARDLFGATIRRVAVGTMEPVVGRPTC